MQVESFRRHIDLAKRLDKTLVIHDRDAHDEVLRGARRGGRAGALGDALLLRRRRRSRARCLDRGAYLSFAGTVTFKNAQPLRDALAVAPRDRVLVETDAPYLTPTPYRGRPNASYLVPLTCARWPRSAATTSASCARPSTPTPRWRSAAPGSGGSPVDRDPRTLASATPENLQDARGVRPAAGRPSLREYGVAVLGQHEPGLDRGVGRGLVRRQVRLPRRPPRGQHAAGIGSVRPKSAQIGDASGAAKPDSTSTGASTTGVRTPPTHVADAASSTKPSADHRQPRRRRAPPARRAPSDSSHRSAARTTYACWPRLTGSGTAEERLELADLEAVRVRGARDLPQPEELARPAAARAGSRAGRRGRPRSARRAPARQVAPDRDRLAADPLEQVDAAPGRAQRQRRPAAAVHQEPVEDRGLAAARRWRTSSARTPTATRRPPARTRRPRSAARPRATWE